MHIFSCTFFFFAIKQMYHNIGNQDEGEKNHHGLTLVPK